SFGPSSGKAVGDATAALLRPQDVFGPSLDAALAADHATAACQLSVPRALAKLGLAQMGAFNRCKARGLARVEISSSDTLAGCFTAADGPSVAALATRLGKQTARKCRSTPIATAFPGKCGGSTPDALLACVRDL